MNLSKRTLSYLKAAFGDKKAADELQVALNTAESTDHAHTNTAILALIEEAFTSALKSTYDGYASEISGKVAKADGVASGSFTDKNDHVITVVNGQITNISA